MNPIEVVARRVVADLAEQGAEWEDYPEIGEYDWNDVRAEARRIVSGFAPSAEEYAYAYRELASRADPNVV